MDILKVLFKTIAFCTIVFFTSCTNKHEISRERYSAMNISEKIDYLYEVFPDTSTFSRIALALPENINKIKSGQLNPSKKFSQRIDEICEYYITNDYNKPKTLREFDPNFAWYDKIWCMDDLYGWYWFWGIMLVAMILSALCENGAPSTIFLVFYFVCGLLSLIFFVTGNPVEKEPYPSYEPLTYKSNTINKGATINDEIVLYAKLSITNETHFLIASTTTEQRGFIMSSF